MVKAPREHDSPRRFIFWELIEKSLREKGTDYKESLYDWIFPGSDTERFST